MPHEPIRSLSHEPNRLHLIVDWQIPIFIRKNSFICMRLLRLISHFYDFPTGHEWLDCWQCEIWAETCDNILMSCYIVICISLSQISYSSVLNGSWFHVSWCLINKIEWLKYSDFSDPVSWSRINIISFAYILKQNIYIDMVDWHNQPVTILNISIVSFHL